MSWLSQVFNLAINLISLPFVSPDNSNGISRSDNAIFPFDVLRNMPQPCHTYSFEMGGNEVKMSALAKGLCPNCCPIELERDVRFVAYSKSNQGGIPIEMRSGSAHRAGVVSNHPTVVFIHGFSEGSPGLSGKMILNAYFSRKEPRNIILVNWSELATFPWYQSAVTNVKHVAQRLRKFIEIFNDSGEIPVRNLHIIGFSLGCHVAGIAGELLRRDLRIPRITALDPALPEYSLKDSSKQLSKDDANYVDVIHTDAGIFGLPISVGHADFYPNGGRALQPGCQPSYLVRQRIIDQVLACSHVRAWQLYAESVMNERAFPASKCSLWRGPDKECDFTIDAYMGFINNNRTYGDFFLITHESRPYGRRRG